MTALRTERDSARISAAQRGVVAPALSLTKMRRNRTMAFKDITGMRFGRLVAERFVEFREFGTAHAGKRAAWEFRCDCGGSWVTLAQTVKAKDYPGHGCPACLLKVRRDQKTTHGGTGTRLHDIWIGMRSRCTNRRDTGYADYGGRGITVSPAWDEFPPFHDWSLANGYACNLELDRIDNDGPYSPDNCQWLSHKANARKTRRTRWVEYCGHRMSLSAFASETGVHANTISQRLSRGLSPEDAIAGSKGPRRVEWRGRQLTLAELSAETGIPKNTIYGRIVRLGMTAEQAVALPRDSWTTRRLRAPS